jgi:NitT/TauT family transport system substrate-binding protein
VRTDWLLRHGEVVRGIIAARRRAVHAIREEPAQAALIITGHYGVEPGAALALAERLLAGQAFWSDGSFDDTGMDTMHRGLQRIGALPTGATGDWRSALRADYLS